MLLALTSLFGFAQKTSKGNVGKLESYVHSYVADPMQEFDRDYSYSLSRLDSKGFLTVSFGDQESPAVEVGDTVFQKVEEMICCGRLYETDKASEAKWMKRHPITAHSSETITMYFEGDKKHSGIVIPSDQHREGIAKLDSYLAGVYKDLTKRIPDGDMIYCSCSARYHGMPAGEVHHDFYELITDKDKAPKVVHGVDRGDGAEKTEYAATAEDVAKLHKMLSDLEVIKLKDYQVEERLLGGVTYRVYMEFSSGEKLNSFWFTERPNPLARKVFNTIRDNLYKISKR